MRISDEESKENSRTGEEEAEEDEQQQQQQEEQDEKHKGEEDGEVYYDSKRSFFDHISCEALEKQEGFASFARKCPIFLAILHPKRDASGCISTLENLERS